MREWGERMKGLGAKVLAELPVKLDPKDEDLARCREAGALLAGN